jgi:hypothetical protein
MTIENYEFEPTRRKKQKVSPRFNALGGQFAVGETIVPFFTCHLSAEEAADLLKTPDQLTQWSDGEVEIEALFQRQIDHRRVDHKITPYLTNPGSDVGRPRFFNAITIALVPHRNGTIIGFDNSELVAPPLSGRASNAVESGPISLGFYRPYDPLNPESYEVATLQWNTDQTACVAIDGQHRLQAIKRAFKQNKLGDGMRLCVIFVLPSPAFGFKASGAAEMNPLWILRSIFIDLNKHAKPVKRSRLILLDDTDPHCLSVRRLLGGKLKEIDAQNPIEDGHRVPLGLIDWHTDDAKFESGPYVSTVLMVDRAVQTLLNAKSVTDWSAKNLVQRQMTAFKRIGYKPTPECDQSFSAFDSAEEAWQQSFAYPDKDLKLIQDVVGKAYGPVVGKVLTKIAPYADLIQHRGRCGMLGTEFASWYEAKMGDDGTAAAGDRLRIVQDHLRSLNPPRRLKVWEDFLSKEVKAKKEKNLFFTVVFQDAIFDAIRRLNGVPIPVFGEEPAPPPKNEVKNLHWWCECLISALNHVIDNDRKAFRLDYQFKAEQTSRHLWLGSFLKPDGTIDYSNQAVDRGSYWLVVVGMLGAARDAWARHNRTQLPSTLEDAIGIIGKHAPDYAQKLNAELERLKRGAGQNKGAMDRIVMATQQAKYEELSTESLDKLINDELTPRAELFWKWLRG